MATPVSTFTGFLAWMVVTAVLLLGVGLVPGWTQALLGWALTNLFEALIPGYAESQAH